MLSGRGLCDELITRPEESYRLFCVVVCDLETLRMGAPYIYDISRLRVNQGQIMQCIVNYDTGIHSRLPKVSSKLLLIFHTNHPYILHLHEQESEDP